MHDFLGLIKAIKKDLLCRTHKWKLPSLHTWYRAKASQSLKRFGVKTPGPPGQSCSHIFTFLALVLLFQASLSEALGKGLSGLSDKATLWKEGETLKTLPTLTQYPVLSPSYLSTFLHLRVQKNCQILCLGLPQWTPKSALIYLILNGCVSLFHHGKLNRGGQCFLWFWPLAYTITLSN